MTVVSNGQFWIYTIGLLIVWIIVLTTAFNNDSNTKNKVSSPYENNEDELKNTGHCKNLCKHCGCLPFYCGEECICECNNEHSDTECIGLIQTNAKKLNIPFEVLIQGPTANTFVRKALQFEQNNERKSFGYRNKRSTVTVYKPNIKLLHEISLQPHEHNIKSSRESKTLIKDIFIERDRRKRSTENFNWFSDLSNHLLRPAPLGLKKRKTEELKPQPASLKTTKISTTNDNSWFSAMTPSLLTPAPLIKRKTSKAPNDNYDDNDIESSLENLNIRKISNDNSEFIDDFSDHKEMDKHYNDELKNRNTFLKDDFLPEEKNPQESEESLTDDLYASLLKIDSKSNIFKEESEETAFLDNDLESENKDKDSLLPEKQKNTDETGETLTGGLYERLFKSDKTQALLCYLIGLSSDSQGRNLPKLTMLKQVVYLC
ncbi:uncharacterized protein ACRADG_003272 [Cochliomyia hominivorax]